MERRSSHNSKLEDGKRMMTGSCAESLIHQQPEKINLLPCSPLSVERGLTSLQYHLAGVS